MRNPLLAAAAIGAIGAPVALGSARAEAAADSGPPASPPAQLGSAALAASLNSNQLHVVPFPGTPDVAPDSQIIFSSLVPSDLSTVTVLGSRSGRHPGHVDTLPDHAGAEFVPDQPFAPGEQVQVIAGLTSPRAGTASGAPGATRLSFSFTVGVPVKPTIVAAADRRRRSGPQASAAENRGRVQWFHSQIAFHPPVVSAGSDPDNSSGDIFLSPNNAPQVGSMILNSRGQLVWFRRVYRSAVFNLEVQRYQGRSVLTWWHGNVYDGHGINGQDVIMGQAYRIKHIVTAGHGYTADLHEFQITPQGTALIDAYVPIHMNLTRYHGPKNGTVLDCVIQEIDIKTNRVLWEWDSLAHIPLSDSYARPTNSEPWDYFHLNSIQQQPNNNLLISGRNTWAAYLIGESKGDVIWSVGGKHSSFRMGTGTNFEWQHDARLIGTTLSVFNDGALPREESESSAKQILVSRSAMTATLQHTYTHSPPLLAGSQGSAQTLSNDDIFVGWGSEPEFSEYNTSGQQIFNGTMPLGVTSYRAYRFHWYGQPATPPDMANSPGRTGDVTVWASWNGATTVGSWRVLGGSKSRSLHVLDARTDAQGFETTIRLHSEPRYFAVQALGLRGRVLLTSTPHLDKRHLAIFGPDMFVRTSNGFAGVPVGCFTGSDCGISLRVRMKGAIVGQSSQAHVTGGTGTLVYVPLNSSARNALSRSSTHHVLMEITARGTSGISDTTYLTAVPYATRGPGPSRHISRSTTVKVANTTAFASSNGTGQLMAGCYAAVPCQFRVRLSADGHVIATGGQHIGVAELEPVYFRLNSIGQSALSHASGNQLATQVRLTNGSSTVTGQIALVRHG